MFKKVSKRGIPVPALAACTGELFFFPLPDPFPSFGVDRIGLAQNALLT
jgi:hypothetical protein